MTAAPWLAAHRHLLPPLGTALDVACGRGRPALWLAGPGFSTHAVDRDAEAVQFLRAEAGRLHLPVVADVVDLEVDGVSLGHAAYDVVVVMRYLHRPLFPALRAAVKPGGVLVYETFTRAQAARGRPGNPRFLLEEGELRQLIQPLTVLAEREGDFDGAWLSSIIATAR